MKQKHNTACQLACGAKHILILEGYARQCLPYMRAFKQLGMEVTLLCNSKLDCGYVSRLPDHKILGICDPESYEESEKYIVNLIMTGKYDLVLPLVDFSAKILANNKEQLSSYAYICTNDKNVFKQAQDKLQVMRTCMENGIPCPITLFDIQDLEQVKAAQLPFPIVIKPRTGYGARGFKRFENLDALEKYVEENHIDLAEMVIQECLPMESLPASDNIFVDDSGEIQSSFVYGCYRFYPIEGGTGTLNMTIKNEQIQECSRKLAKILGLKSCNGIDYMIDPRDGIAKVIEVNPRVLACSRIGFLAGVNQARQIVENAFGLPITQYANQKYGMCVRMSQIDFLWFLKSTKRLSAKPSWFSNKNTADQMFSWDDPLPWFAFLAKGLFGYGGWKSKHK